MIDNDSKMLPIGALLKQGEYRVEDYIASGGFGNTYRIVNTTFNEVFALKEFFLRGVNDRNESTLLVSVSNDVNAPEFQSQKNKFRKEAMRLRKIKNPHVVRVYDLFEENGTAYYVMDFLQGQSLSAQMKQRGMPFSEAEVKDFTLQTMDALQTIHSENIWHLDLKPGNMMTDGQGRVVLIDFGASKQFSDADGHSLSTSTGLCYTPGYAPTEQIEGSINRMGPWTDIYALGATMYNLLTMKTPPSVTDIQDGNGFQFPSNVSVDTQRLIQWMMEPNRKNRPQSIVEICSFMDGKTDISQSMHSEPTRLSSESFSNTNATQSTRPAASQPTVVSKSSKTNWLPWALGLVAIILLLIGIFVFSRSSKSHEYEPDDDDIESRPLSSSAYEQSASDSHSSSSTYEPSTPVQVPEQSEPNYIESEPQLSLYLTGTLGGATDAVLQFNESSGSGYVTFTAYGANNYRDLTLGSYNRSSGRLVLYEYYANGTYIGLFEGTYKNGRYKGVFTNENTGGKVDFDLY